MSEGPLNLLKKYWGHDAFRSLQEDIIQSVLDGHNTLALLPTGGGKSICFQIPVLAMEGICVVVSPLIALMKDQVHQLNTRGIKAIAIYSGMSKKEIDVALDNCIYGDIKFLYLSPERLKTDIFLERSTKMKISLLAIDEAHCISQWGYDFRPPYLEIIEFRKTIPEAKLIALTATATPDVERDIVEKLEMDKAKVFKKSFARANLSYSVFQKENKEQKLLEILKKVPGSSIIYARNRKKTKALSEFLVKCGISSDYYHAGLGNKLRAEKQENWINNKTRVMVATNAFGMGIDKPDVRSVIHMDIPDSLENYYQEAGRAGRDEKKAYAVLLYNHADIKEQQDFLEAAFPPVEAIKKCYQSLANYFKVAVGSNFLETYDFRIEDFCNASNIKPYVAFVLIGKLEEEGLIQLSESFFQPSRITISISRTDLYEFQIKYENLEGVVKAILRLYGGEAFHNYVDISEAQVGKLSGLKRREVVNKLELLHQREIIRYNKQKDCPQLTFLTARQDASKLTINLKRIKERKVVRTDKLEAMVKYAMSLTHCRTRLIQEYFGEAVYDDCGVCDYCVRRKKSISKLPPSVKEQIIQTVSGKPIGLDELWSSLSGIKEDDFINLIRELLDEGVIGYTKYGKVEVK